MTRPKVDPDKRQRTAIACGSCKRRKQKCNGHQPCSNCTRRSLSCSYSSSDIDSTGTPSANKRRMLTSPQNTSLGMDSIQGNSSFINPPASSVHLSTLTAAELQTSDKLSRGTNSMSGQEEEAIVYNASRMLQDPRGRLLYLGDSATLSFLQLVRMIVEWNSGTTPFTSDPSRHRITENTLSLPKDTRTTQLLPSKETAFVLLNSFFDNTCGLVEVLNRATFMIDVENCYSDPLGVDPGWLCLLHLVFANGLVMATPVAGTKDDEIIQKLRAVPLDQAELFYLNAKSQGDPSSFETPDVWSTQALLLTTLYMLAVSKRNTAYHYFGMAIRSAFALGLHREESMVIFSPEQRTIRRNLWRSLFVVDRFLSCSLGRPTSISEDDCSDAPLKTVGEVPAVGTLESQGLTACVRSCHFIGLVLEKVYAKRKISTKLGQELADKCKDWSKGLDSRLNWEQSGSLPINQGIAILNVNLFHCHSLILLTRPFFLSVLRKVEQDKLERTIPKSRRPGLMSRFSEACLVASCHSIVLIQNSMEARCLSRRNPFVTYFLFSSALIILCNEYAQMHATPLPGAETCIKNAIQAMNFMAEVDPQAQRLHYVLTIFHDVVKNRHQTSKIPITSVPQGNPADCFTYKPNITATPEYLPIGIQLPTPPSIQQVSTPLSPDMSASASFEPPTSVSIPLPTTSRLMSAANSLETLFDFQNFSFGGDMNMEGSQHSDQDLSEIDFNSLWNSVPGSVPMGTGGGYDVPLFGMEYMRPGGMENMGQFMSSV